MTLSERIALHEETAKRLVLIERCSSLTTVEFCRAILALSTNDSVLRTVLKRGTFERSNDNPIATQLPIATAGDNFVFVKPI